MRQKDISQTKKILKAIGYSIDQNKSNKNLIVAKNKEQIIPATSTIAFDTLKEVIDFYNLIVKKYKKELLKFRISH